MRDPVTGLEVAAITHLPEALQDALRHNLADEQVPFVYFAEVLKKVSQGGKNRGDKDRLVLITGDTLFLYAADGTVKRKVRLLDVVAVYVESFVDTDEAASDGPATEDGGPSPFRDARTIVLCIPTSYDIALETNKSCSATFNTLIRVISVLRRQQQRESGGSAMGPELVVRVLATAVVPPLRDRFRLKKPPSRRGVREPILPPSLPPVSSDVIQRQSTDHMLQLEEVLSHLLSELHKYRSECREARATVYAQVCEQRLEQVDAERRMECEITWTRRRVAELRTTNRTREATASAALQRAQLAHTEQLEAIIKLRNHHSIDVEQCQRRIGESESRVGTTKAASVNAQCELLQAQRVLESRIDAEQKRFAELVIDLEASALLPTKADLRREADDVGKAADAIENALDEIRHRKSQTEAMSHLREQLAAENEALRMQLTAARDEVKELLADARRTEVEASALTARKGRLESVVAAILAEEERLAAVESALVASADAVVAARDDLQRRKAALEVENIVVDDLEREALIHDSITSSVVQLMYRAESEAMEVQGHLADQHGQLLHRAAADSRRSVPSIIRGGSSESTSAAPAS